MFRFHYLVIALLFPLVSRAAPGVTLSRIEPTVLFSNEVPPRQIARMSLLNSGTAPLPCVATVKRDGRAEGGVQSFELPVGASVQDLRVPDVTRSTTLRVELTSSDGQPLAATDQTWAPQRKWKVYIIKSSHEDLGYEDFIFNKQKQIADNIDLARKLSVAKDKGPDEPGKPASHGYHYTLETLLFQRNYIDERSEAAWRDIVEKDLKPGRMELMGAPTGDHAQWMDYEEMARSMYPGRREERDRFGLDLKTFMVVDNPSASWSTCQAVSDAGFRYLMRLGQPWRAGGNNDYATTNVPAVFWWEAPDGKNRVLYAWRSHYGTSFWFGQSEGGFVDLTALASQNVDAALQAIQSGAELGPYPWDAMIVPSYQDHETPSWDSRALHQWQKTYRYPEIRIAGVTDFFDYMDKHYSDQLPVLRGELNNFSGDYATIDPTGQGLKRRAARLLPEAEGFAALANLYDPAWSPHPAEVERTFARLFDFTEHSWPTSPGAAGRHLFNGQWIKHQEASRAFDAAQALEEEALKALFTNISTGPGNTVAVFNPVAHAQSGLVEVEGAFASFKDGMTGKTVTTQAGSSGKTLFLALDVPAYGYKTYQAQVGPAAAAADAAASDTIANEFYTIRFDPASGAIASILDKELQRELVDQGAQCKFNQMVWVRRKTRDGKQGSDEPIAPGAKLTVRSGPVRTEMISTFDDPKTGASVTQTVALGKGNKRIDITDDIRHLRAFSIANVHERYRENIFFAFPVDVKNFTDRVEYPGGVVRPYDDQLRWGSHDFLNANRWVDVSNADFGVTMAPWEATTVHFGEIRYNQFSIDYKPATSHLFSYAWSNRMAGLIELGPEEWNTTLHYSFTSHRGNWDSGETPRFGWNVASPLQARVLAPNAKGHLPAEGKSLLSVEAVNVQLVTLKQSLQPGRGWVARFVETVGKATDTAVDLSSFPIQGAVRCNLVEDDGEAIPVTNGRITLHLRPYSFATVRFFAADAEPGAVLNAKGESVSDQSIKLSWTPAQGAAAYFVYRSEDPGAPASAYNLVARAASATFADDHLKIGTKYYYRIAAVTAANRQGPVCNQFSVSTDARSVSAPGSVTGLGIVRYSPEELKVYWDKSPDPAVARYIICRGENKTPGATPLAFVPANQLFLQVFLDTGLKENTTYHYKVYAEDWAGHRQTESPETSATTPAAGAGLARKIEDK